MNRPSRQTLSRSLAVSLAATALVAAFGAHSASAQLLPPPDPNVANPITPAKVRLGKVLFWDEQLSSSRTVSCGTCHIPRTGGGDPRSAASPLAIHPGVDGIYGNADDIFGSPGVPAADSAGFYSVTTHFGMGSQTTNRRTNSMINAAYSRDLFWDGRAGQNFVDPITTLPVWPGGGSALESQAMGPPTNDVEMGHQGRLWTDVVTRVAASQPLALATDAPTPLLLWIGNRSYAQLFTEAFGSADISAAKIGMAIASYERTLWSDQTPFDAWLLGDEGAMTEQELAGRDVFSIASCDRCHSGALMSDNQFHYIGVRPHADDQGRYAVTFLEGDRGKMRTPSLRNVQMRPPYMHNGRFPDLESVVEFYNRGGDFTEANKDPQVRPLNLTPEDKAALLAFLKRPLNDRRLDKEDFPFDRPRLYTESQRVPKIEGSGQAGTGGLVPMAVALEPALIGNTITFGVQNGRGGAPVRLVIHSSDPGLVMPGTGDFALVNETLEGTSGAAGAGYVSVRVSVPNNPALADREYFGRWYVTDASGSGGVAVSRLFRFKVFPTLGAATVWVDNFESGTTGRWSSTIQ